jgi:hypothetical protein
MTQKDYQIIAGALASATRVNNKDWLEAVAMQDRELQNKYINHGNGILLATREIAEALKRDNSRFDLSKFEQYIAEHSEM